MHFTDLQKDALCEVFNISVNQAAAAMSDIVQQPIRMTVPDIDICDLHQAIGKLDTGQAICGISQQFTSSFSGKAILLFPEHRSLELVRLMMGLQAPLDQISELEQDALAEIGNIVLNACLSSLSQLFGQRFDYSIPQLVIGDCKNVLSEYDQKQLLILLHIRFFLEQQELEGTIIFVVNMQSLCSLQECIATFVKDISH